VVVVVVVILVVVKCLQDPCPLPYLQHNDAFNFDIKLDVKLKGSYTNNSNNNSNNNNNNIVVVCGMW